MTLSTVPDETCLGDVWRALPGDAARAANYAAVECYAGAIDIGMHVQTRDGDLRMVTGRFTARGHVAFTLRGRGGATVPASDVLVVRTWRRLTPAQLRAIECLAEHGAAPIQRQIRDDAGRVVAVTKRTAASLAMRALVPPINGARTSLTGAGEATYVAHKETRS